MGKIDYLELRTIVHQKPLQNKKTNYELAHMHKHLWNWRKNLYSEY